MLGVCVLNRGSVRALLQRLYLSESWKYLEGEGHQADGLASAEPRGC